MKGSEKLDKEQVEHVNPSFIALNSKVKYLEFLYASLFQTPHQIVIRQQITLISSTPHALEVFTIPTTTFEDTLD
jgi:hypothetical protein